MNTAAQGAVDREGRSSVKENGSGFGCNRPSLRSR
jgi:hypothetical protein